MTTSVEAAFGSHRMTGGGFLLNNQMTDFAREAVDANGAPLANAPAGGKRPRSSMSPVIVLDRDSGAFVLAAGSPGGNSIPSYVVKALVALLDWEMTPQQAADLPNIVARGDRTAVESGFDAERLSALRAMGHQIGEPRGENSGIHIVRALPDGSLTGGADSRREGVARVP
jgi:gamma-glutamyltranspeptidase/glutathione hydrolase